jgi:exonuclease SbcD
MPLKILHTADNHIGLSFAKFPDDIRERLVEERFLALERLVKTANQRQAHFIVVAGDLFDKQTVAKKLVKRTASILAQFEGENVLVLAGNHDYYEGTENKLWKAFKSEAEGTCIIPLLKQETKEFDLDDGRVRFYACPCPSKHSSDHMIGWTGDEDKEDGTLHIGIAHGNVEGFGLDSDNRYFNMSETDLQSTGLDSWLLGHIHVPFPKNGTSGKPTFFMPGIHAPDSIKCSHSGHAWWIEISDTKTFNYEQLISGELRFVRISHALADSDDVQKLGIRCEKYDLKNTILNFQLSGRLDNEGKKAFRELCTELSDECLYFSDESIIATVLDAASISAKYPDGTLPNSLLLELLADDDHPEDAQIALEIMESINAQ